MSYEINILVLNQKKPVKLLFESSILLHDEKENYEVNRYAEIWPYFSSSRGILYSLMSVINEDYYTSFPLCNSDFDTVISPNLLQIPVSEEERMNISLFIIKEKYYNDFVKIIEFLLKSAPENRILFLTRYQGGEKEIVVGVLKWKEFLNMLNNDAVFFNICYIIEL